MSKKPIDTQAIVNELAGASAYFAPPKKSTPPQKFIVDKEQDQSVSQSISQPTNRPVSQPTDQLTDVDELGPVVDRPKALYITRKVDAWLDDAVRHLQSKGLHKVDRSVLTNAILHDPKLYSSKHLKQLRARILAHLTNKSLRRG